MVVKREQKHVPNYSRMHCALLAPFARKMDLRGMRINRMMHRVFGRSGQLNSMMPRRHTCWVLKHVVILFCCSSN